MSSEIVKREIAKDSEKKGKRKNKRNNSIHLQENSKEIKGVDNEIFYDFLDQRMIKSKSRRVRSNRTQILNDYKNL